MDSNVTLSPPAAIQERITAYWDQRATAYDRNQAHQIRTGEVREAWRAVWRDALPEAPCEVFDVGCGTGQVSLLLAEMGYRVTGTDLSEGMLALARQKAVGVEPVPTFAIGDAIHPDLPEASFDAVTARYLLWTLHAPGTALENWRRTLRPGGRLVVVDSTWFPDGLHHPESSASNPDRFQELYSPSVVANLPLAESSTIEDTVAAIRAAGYLDVSVSELTTIELLDRAQLSDLEHPVRLQYAITATNPGA